MALQKKRGLFLNIGCQIESVRKSSKLHEIKFKLEFWKLNQKNIKV